jgi:hypothetical protein
MAVGGSRCRAGMFFQRMMFSVGRSGDNGVAVGAGELR